MHNPLTLIITNATPEVQLQTSCAWLVNQMSKKRYLALKGLCFRIRISILQKNPTFVHFKPNFRAAEILASEFAASQLKSVKSKSFVVRVLHLV